MGPHYVFGLSWPELGSIVGIIVILMALFAWLTHVSITKPAEIMNKALRDSLDRLSRHVDGIGSNAEIVHKDHDRRLGQHDVHLMKHDEEIKTLFKRTGNRRH